MSTGQRNRPTRMDAAHGRMARRLFRFGVGDVARIVARWVRRAPPPVAEPVAPEPGRTAREARARFWAELREGQREADARAARPRPDRRRM